MAQRSGFARTRGSVIGGSPSKEAPSSQRFWVRSLAHLVALVIIALVVVSGAWSQTLSLSDMGYSYSAPDSNALTRFLKLSWTPPASNISITGMKRTAGAQIVSFGVDATTRTAVDSTWVSGTQYSYYLYGMQTLYDPATMQYYNVNWQSNSVTVRPYDLSATDDATADSRIDPRYGTSSPVYINFPFNDSNTTNNPLWLYRGGLYAGYNADGGKVGRTYLKFTLAPAGVATTLYPVGGLYAFCTRLPKTGSAGFVTKRSSAATSWTASALNWSNAPVPTGTAGATQTISWSSSTPASAWYKVDAKTPVQDYLSTSGTGVLTLILMAQSETTAGWGYFARKEFVYNTQTGYGARLIFGVQ